MRILCLHGTCSSGAIMKMQLARLLPLLKPKAELIFIDGPLRVEDDNPMLEEQQKVFGSKPMYDFARWVKEEGLKGSEAERKKKGEDDLWEKFPSRAEMAAFFRTNPEERLQMCALRKYHGLEEALAFLQEQLRLHAPIDGVLGFSQGANLASLLVAQALAGKAPRFSFAIHICAGRPGWVEQYPDLFKSKLSMRSLHISGEVDLFNPPLALKELYENPVCLEHDDGHRPIPGTSAEQANAVAKTLADFILADE